MSLSATRQRQTNDALEARRDFRLAFDENLRLVNFGDHVAWHVHEGALLLHRYIGLQSPRPAFAPVVGHALRPAATVSSDGGATYGGDNIYWHWVEEIGRGGIPAATLNRLTRAVVYEGGAYVGLLPNPATHITLRQTTDLKVIVSWVYNPLDQQVVPATFKVFSNGGSGPINLDTPVGSVSYAKGEYSYRWISGQYAAGTEIAFTVRAKSAAGAYSLIPVHADAYRGTHHQYAALPLTKAARILIVERSLSAPPAPVFM
jgi:hypothetical protein